MQVAVADDSALFRQGLSALLASAGMVPAIEARDGEDLKSRLSATMVDVVILDLRMPPTFTDEGVRVALDLRRRYPELGILVLSTYAEVSYAMRLLTGGGNGVGYLLKDNVDTLDVLLDALRRVHRMETVIDPTLVVQLVRHRRVLDALDALNPRERSVLSCMAEGRSNQAIAEKLHLSTKTVEGHIASIFQHLGLAPDTGDNRRVLAVLSWLRRPEQRG